MKSLLKSLAKGILRAFEPAVKGAAKFYGIELRKKYMVYGQNPLVIEDDETERRFIPKSVYFNTRSGSIFVGKNTKFSENVMVLTGKHINIAESERSGLPLHSVPEEGRDIHIGRDCFIGGGAIILGNIKIGDKAVIGAGAVVVKDVPARTMVAGVPAKVIQEF